MKIAVNSRLGQYQNSGIGVFINNLYERIVKLDKENEYQFIKPDREPKSALEVWWYENFRVVSGLNKDKVRLLHGPAHTLPWIKPSGVKYLLTVHDVSFLTVKEMGGWMFKIFYTILLARSIKVADYIVTDSENTKQDLIKYMGTPIDKITTVYLACDKDFVPKRSNPSHKYLLTVATHPKRKNLKILVQAFNEVSGKYPIHLYVVGQLPKNEMQIIKDHNLADRVHHFEALPKDDLVQLYQGAEAFVYPSLYEGFGLPVVESMACQIPALCSDNSSLPEIQTDARQRFNANDVAGLAKLLDSVLASSKLRNEMGRRNLKAAHRFSWDYTARQYLKIISCLLPK